MEKDFDSWFRQSTLCSSGPQCGGSYFPAMGYFQPNNRLFNSLPCFHPLLKYVSEENYPVTTDLKPETVPERSQRKFLVFDQSGDQMRLVYSPSPNESSPENWVQNPSTAYNQTRFLVDECVEENNEESEMQEDTEELNALLYSDNDSDYSEDEEVTSTGNSKPEVASSDEEHTKRRKLLEASYAVPWTVESAMSENPFGCSGLEDDAESSCRNMHGHVSGMKRSRKEKIRETLHVLQKIIPGGKGKGAMDVIDGTICYLKGLKVEAKSLRLDAL
ncbi:unnamed protein product [Cuscuta europaea]|uniref:BHLH domain-containing protein n=1 Tax=Cuscuta europaea TaxID=41803 RepID=A0A9P0YVF1_CUSEU|nr:unnamed protein product [Cuscuta europaea]